MSTEIKRINTGDKVANRYRIDKLIGRGGMGEVFLAVDLMLQKQQIALKALHCDMCENKQHVERFLREIHLTRMVTHPAVVRTFDCGQEREQLYYTMEYIEGQSLQKEIRKGPLEIPKGMQYFYELCWGMDEIHQAGIVHRDLKPSNVLISSEKRVKITDFGVARPAASDLTRSSEIVGSGGYVAPEVWAGKKITPSTDIYSLGIMAHQFFTGSIPFTADSPAQMMFKHLSEEASPKPLKDSNLPDWLSDIILQMLSKQPKDRPQSMLQIMEDLESHFSIDFPIPSYLTSRLGRRSATSEENQPILEDDLTSLDNEALSEALEYYSSNDSQPLKTSSIPRLAKLGVRKLFSREYRILFALISLVICILLVSIYSVSTSFKSPDKILIDPAPSIPNTLAWFRAEDLYIPSGAPISKWVDFASHSKYARQLAPAHRPTFFKQPSTKFPLISFDGRMQYLTADWIADKIKTTDSLTVICVARSRGHNTRGYLWSIHTDDRHSDVLRAGFGRNNTVNVLVGEHADSVTKPEITSRTLVTTNFAIYSFVFTQSFAGIHFNGSEIGGMQSKIPIPFSKAHTFTIGQEWDWGRPTDFFAGELAEFLIFSPALKSTERRQVEKILAKRFQISLHKKVSPQAPPNNS